MLVAPGASLEFGNEEVLVRSADLLAEAHPFAVLSLDRGGLTLAYALATSPGMDSAEQAAQEGRLMPAAVERRGKVALEHGLHQQVSLKRETARGELTLIAFADDIRNPALNGWGSLDEADAERGDLLVDAGDRAFRGTGPDFRSVGFAAVLHRHLPGAWVTVSVANGSTLALGAQPAEGTNPAAVAAGARPARATLATASVEAMLPLTRTRVRGGYRWQPAASVTSVAPYQAEEISPYLRLCVRPPLHGRAAANGLEATIEARNLLAQGYRAFLTSDGSTVFFAQADRSIRGSLAFTF
jgi:hypothetical protein